MTGIEKLYDLSSTDRKIEYCSESIREIDLALNDNYILHQNQENLNKASTILQTQETRRTDSELLFQSTKTKGDKIEKDLYGGSISNPRELEDMQKEGATANLRGFITEDIAICRENQICCR